jgi:hypothetical protein
MKIELQGVTFKNFLTFGNAEQSFVLKPGITLITGLDHSTGRSNGSGKCIEGKTKINISITDEAKCAFLSFLNH